MNRHIVFGSILSASLMVLVSFLSMVGCHSVEATGPQETSPLFTIRTQQATHQQSSSRVATFLGKGTATPLFPASADQREEMIQTALHLFQTHPAVLSALVKNLQRYPYLAGLLAKHGVAPEDLQTYLQLIQNNPSLSTDVFLNGRLSASPTDPAQPLGLSTSNPLGCVIVAIFVMVPVIVTLTLLLLLFTLRILTCINFNNCANDLAQSIWDQMIQGLTQEEVAG